MKAWLTFDGEWWKFKNDIDLNIKITKEYPNYFNVRNYGDYKIIYSIIIFQIRSDQIVPSSILPSLVLAYDRESDIKNNGFNLFNGNSIKGKDLNYMMGKNSGNIIINGVRYSIKSASISMEYKRWS